MSNYPIDYGARMTSDYFNMQPSEVKGKANDTVAYYKRYLYTKLYSCYKFTLPEDWKLNYFRYWLFNYGSIAVIYTNEFGWVCQPYSIIEHDLYYQPKKIQVYNKFINKPKVGLIGINADIVRIMDDFFGVDDLVTKYAVQLAQIDKAFAVNIMNCNTSAMYGASNKKEADEIKEAYGQASEGKPFVVVGDNIKDKIKEATTALPNPTSAFLGDKLLDARATVVKQFLTEIGIKNANTEKKERLISDEVNQNNNETEAIIDVIFDNIKACFDSINSFANLGLKVELRYNYDEGNSSNKEDKDNGISRY